MTAASGLCMTTISLDWHGEQILLKIQQSLCMQRILKGVVSINKKPRLLIFGAGAIGSLYALQFFKKGFDVTLLARGNRLEKLREDGLLHNEKGRISSVPVRVIDVLQDDDVYDFIFVTVRYDQMESALASIKGNKSENIVTLSNAASYDAWTAIAGDRLIPGFPGAGGDIVEGVLSAQFVKGIQGTVFGEIDGKKTERIKCLSEIFKHSDLAYEVSENILAFHLSHAAFAAAIKHFYAENGMLDSKAAKRLHILMKLASSMKENIHALEKAGIPILDPKTRLVGKMPKWITMLIFYIMLSVKFTQSVLLGNHALAAKEETFQLDKAFREMA
jgi:2-dehydropantoate 2-reductase